jgi:hypothetical protein
MLDCPFEHMKSLEDRQASSTAQGKRKTPSTTEQKGDRGPGTPYVYIHSCSLMKTFANGGT